MPAFSISKSIEIDVPREDVFAVVRDFRSWPKWSPWLIAEPDCRLNFAKDGNSYSWAGKVIGSGEIAVKSETAPEVIHSKLTFLKPWKSVADVSFSFREAGAGKTQVVWKMDSSLPFFMFWMKDMMVGMIGMDYDRGLRMLKDFVETGSVPSKLKFSERKTNEFAYVGIRTRCEISDVGPSMERDMAKIGAWTEESGVAPTGNPFAIYHKWDFAKGNGDYTIGFPVAEIPSDLAAGFVSGKIPETKNFTVTHTGPYRHLGNAWSAGMMHERAKVFSQRKEIDPFEIYENNPEEVAEGELIATVYIPKVS